jgi:hypothetical protein
MPARFLKVRTRAGGPHNAQEAQKNQFHVFWKYLTDLLIAPLRFNFLFMWLTAVLDVHSEGLTCHDHVCPYSHISGDPALPDPRKKGRA